MNHFAPVEVIHKTTKCLIIHNPTNGTLNKCIVEFKNYGVTPLGRVCEATYNTTPVEKEGIPVLDWPFDDYAPPSKQIVDDCLRVVKITFPKETGCCIAVHCIAGLGSAPGLVAIALMEGGINMKMQYNS